MAIEGTVLELARLTAGLTRIELAEKLGVSPRTIAHWEHNHVPNHRENLALSKFGSYITNASSEAASIARLHPKEKISSRLTSTESRHSVDAQSLKKRELHTLSLEEALRPHSTKELLGEITRRFDALAELATDGTVPQRPTIVPPNIHGFPNYSNLSEADRRAYGLAAKARDQHIGDEELPNEP